MPHDQMCLKIKMPLNFRKVISQYVVYDVMLTARKAGIWESKESFSAGKFVKTHIGNGNKFYQKFHIAVNLIQWI